MKNGRRFSLFACSAFILLAAGCRRGDGPNRLPIHGTVKTSSGEKLNGSITFSPDEGKKPPATGNGRPSATIGVVNGEYHFDRTSGPTAGPTNVMVHRIVHRGATMKSIAERSTAAPQTMQWELKRDVPDDGAYRQDFTVEN